MTNREFLENVVAGTINDEMIEHAQTALAQLDAQNTKRREKSAEKAIAREVEKAPIRNAILEVIGAEPKTATMLIEEAGLEIKPQSIPSLLKSLVDNGTIQKTQLKIKGKSPAVAYVRVASAE